MSDLVVNPKHRFSDDTYPFSLTVDQVDIWNIIECFRENGLNTLEADTELNASRVESIVTSIFLQLNKRIPVSRQVDVQASVNMLLNWLLSAYDRLVI